MLPTPPLDDDSRHALDAVAATPAIPSILEILRGHTGMRFAAVARVTDDKWLACAAQDHAGLGLSTGGLLPIHTTLCKEARATRETVAFDCASSDPVYADHHTPRLYGFESYISTPIVLPDGSYFGNLCALDPEPRAANSASTRAMFMAYATLIGQLLGSWEHMAETSRSLGREREMSNAREQFLAVVAHDLRNPLGSVSAAAELLLRGGDALGQRVGKRLRGTAERMSGLVADLSDYARGRSGRAMSARMAERTDLGESLLAVVDEVRDSAPGREIEARVALDTPLACDAARMQQLLANLLGNAVAYGDPSRPIVAEARVEGGEALVAVTNQGAPIPPERLERLFEAYWSASEGGSEAGHMGLGLHICRQIADAHGGTLTVESSEAAGTRFEARWPCQLVQPGTGE